MSNRSMIEFNHDYAPNNEDTRNAWLAGMLAYFRSGDPIHLPPGATWFGMRHHTDAYPLGVPPRGWENSLKPNDGHEPMED